MFVFLCANLVLSQAGKRLLLITNSDYQYTNKMMHHAFNRFLPNDMGWRDLFDMVILCFFILFLKFESQAAYLIQLVLMLKLYQTFVYVFCRL